MHTDFL